MKTLFAIITFVASATVAQAEVPPALQPLPLALVYEGPGSCEEECSEVSAQMAMKAGFQTKFIGPLEANPEVFREAKVWIQPGGKSVTASQAMLPQLKANLVEFVRQGGGYVGFCAGGFLATTLISDKGVAGLGIFPGSTLHLKVENTVNGAAQLPIRWNGRDRDLYFEGGPYFVLEANTNPPQAEVTATYADGKVAAARTVFGKGRVYVVGPHPEAPQSWRDYFKLSDTDGLDEDLAVEMIRWSALRKEPASQTEPAH